MTFYFIKNESFPFKIKKKKKNKIDCSFLSLLFSAVLESLARAIRQQKEIMTSRLES